MGMLKKLGGAYLVAVAVAVAVFFITNNLLSDAIDVLSVWLALDVLMAVGLVLALIFNYGRRRAVGGRDPGEPVTRGYLEAHIAFYATAAVAILFFHNWFALLALGADSLDGNHQAWVIWAAVDTLLPLVLGVTGCRMWQEGSDGS